MYHASCKGCKEQSMHPNNKLNALQVTQMGYTVPDNHEEADAVHPQDAYITGKSKRLICFIRIPRMTRNS